MGTLTAFIARSFADSDEQKIAPILKHLDSFRSLGFMWKSAEPAEVERVSEKVRRIIGECELFIGIVTKRYPVYPIHDVRDVWKALWKRLDPIAWTAPAWILQEIGYALALNRTIMLFRERDVDLPTLQGDLEYIPYDPLSPAEAFRHSTEMLSKLIAKHSFGITVETVVREEQVTADPSKQPALAPEEQRPEKPSEENSVGSYIRDMFEAAEAKDLDAIGDAYRAGLELIRAGKSTLEKIVWEVFYLRRRFDAGDSQAIITLKSLATSHPEVSTPAASVASCLFDYGEYGEAVRFFEMASGASNDADQILYQVRAADALRQAGKVDEAVKKLMVILTNKGLVAYPQVFEKIFQLSLSLGRKDIAIGIGELGLHLNPGLGALRFALGLNYREREWSDMFLYHFNVATEHASRTSDEMHNLALAYSECKLPLLSVTTYKRSFELGEALSAANLGYHYLDAGMADEASSLLTEAAKIANHTPRIERCLAEVDERRRSEESRLRDFLAAAQNRREFLIELGHCFLADQIPPIGGDWEFPFATVALSLSDTQLVGTGEKRGGALWSQFLGESPPTTTTEVETYRLSGNMEGRACKFRLEIESKSEETTSGTRTANWLLMGLSGSAKEKKEGYLLFAADGVTAMYAELKDGKLSPHQKIRKRAPSVSRSPATNPR